MHPDKDFCVPDIDICIQPGNTVKLGRFSDVSWIVGYGWYSWGGNRPFCGWYLTHKDTGEIKPLQKTDTYDIYLIEVGSGKEEIV